MDLFSILWKSARPELLMIIGASVLFLMGIGKTAATRKAAPFVALATMVLSMLLALGQATSTNLKDEAAPFFASDFALYIKTLSAAVGILFVLLSWPSNDEGTGNNASDFGGETAEFFALLVLCVTGIFVVAGANDLILLFLGIELASIPTYIMVSVSRPLPAAQEAGVKYFFLGAMAAAILLLGFSYLYGTTGTTNLTAIMHMIRGTDDTTTVALHGFTAHLTQWQMFAAVTVIAGLAFKMAAVPLHFYAGDVYQGAATPVTALLSFVPKTAGFVALIKILFVLGGGEWGIPIQIAKLLWVLAALTMTVGNVLGLMQTNVKRVLAYSSVAHTGYMLVGISALAYAAGSVGLDARIQEEALRGVLFYLAAYGAMNAAAFGVLILLPSRNGNIASGAETYDDLAGQGRKHIGLGLAMALACFSLIGLPLTVGFFGKFYLIRPALRGHNYWLVGITMANAAISAGYYLKIIGRMFLAAEPTTDDTAAATPIFSNERLTTGRRLQGFTFPIVVGVALSSVATLMLGAIPPVTESLNHRLEGATHLSSEFHYTEPSASVAAAR